MRHASASLTERLPTILRILELVLVTIIVADFARVVVRLIGHDVALGWDEAVYAVRARRWADAGAPLTAWDYFRPPALPLIASPAIAINSAEPFVRSVGLVSGVGLLFAAWWLARMVAGPLAGIAVLAVLSTSPTLQQYSSYLLTDVPSAALLVTVIALIWRELELSPRPGPGLALAAAVAGVAFFMRYGVILALVPIVVLTVAIWWRALIYAPRWPLIALGIGAVVAVGHLAWSVVLTGEPLGILRGSEAAVPVWYSSPPMQMFQAWLPFQLAGTPGAFAIGIGFVAVPVAALAALGSTRWRRPLRAIVLIAAVGVSQVVILAQGIGHVEQRYFIFAVVCLVIAAASVAGLLVAAFPMAARVGLGVAFLAFVFAYRGDSLEFSLHRVLAVGGAYEAMRIAGEDIDRRSSAECDWAGGGGPVVSWYSGCDRRPRGDVPGQPASTSEIDHWYLVLAPLADIDRDNPALAAWIDRADGPPITVRDPTSGRPVATLWSIDP
jgi:4-amino-4-deoxy-L-arabinose transferase-like glycosyltransferase